jgi:hypothetical protein
LIQEFHPQLALDGLLSLGRSKEKHELLSPGLHLSHIGMDTENSSLIRGTIGVVFPFQYSALPLSQSFPHIYFFFPAP